ncbi:MAG: hypothetical protein ISS36_00660 [Candidatus Aenigmarchaeota archaeon]|nr:hypothetical protein [Candidatus Aenigmarchaeota archaeon]
MGCEACDLYEEQLGVFYKPRVVLAESSYEPRTSSERPWRVLGGDEPGMVERFLDSEPVYQSDRLRDYFEPVKSRIDNWTSEIFGSKPYWGDIRVEERRYPVFEYVKSGIRWIGKILGQYEPGKKKITVDSYLLRNGDERMIQRVLGEEGLHAFQHKSGAIKRNTKRYGRRSRGYVEGATAYVADRLFGKTPIYRKWKNRFGGIARKYGMKPAFSGSY